MKIKERVNLSVHKSHELLILIITLIIKSYSIIMPQSIVFDEIHTVKFIRMYFKNTFLFDIHPPFTRLLMTFIAYILGVDFDMEGYIGQSYKKPFIMCAVLRAISVFMQAFALIITYKTLRCCLTESKSFLITLFFIFETAFHVHYGLIISDVYVNLYNTLMFYAFVKYYYTRKDKYLLILGLSFSVSISSKLSTLFTIVPYLLWHVCDLYYMAVDKDRNLFIGVNSIFMNILQRTVYFVLLPVFVYLLSFYIHFKFQEGYSDDAEKFSLNFQSIFHNNLLEESDKYLVDRSLVTIISMNTKLYIKSEEKNYEKGSMHQIVYADPYKNENAIWQIIKIYYEGTQHDSFIKNGDYIKIVNVLTGKYLRTDNIFAENSYENKFREVSCYGSVSSQETDDNDVWIIKSTCEFIKTRISSFSLLHPRTGLYLGVMSMPEGKRRDVYSSVDGAHKFRYLYFEDNKIDVHYKQTIQDSRINEKSISYDKPGFLAILYEYHCHMITENNKIDGNRKFRSKPYEWIFMKKGILYWNSLYDDSIKKGGKIIYLTGNKINWLISSLALILPFIIIINIAMFVRKMSRWSFPFILVMGIIQFYSNYLPYFMFNRELYLVHYLTAYYYALMCGLILVSCFGNKVLIILLTLSFSTFFQNRGFLGLSINDQWCKVTDLGEICETI